MVECVAGIMAETKTGSKTLIPSGAKAHAPANAERRPRPAGEDGDVYVR
jgi:hypothetical protein